MSHAASITLSSSVFTNYSVPNIIKMYLANGWNINEHGHISFRPLGDKDDFDWVELEVDQTEEVFEIISKKVEAGEDIGIIMMIDNTKIGAITTFFSKDGSMDFLLMFNRKDCPELPHWTDVCWYLPIILKPLYLNGIGVEKIAFEEMF